MLFKSMILTALAATISVAQQISAIEMTSNIARITTMTQMAAQITNIDVYTDNPIGFRNRTIVFIDAIGQQATLDQDFMTGQACGTLQKRHSESVARRAILYGRQNTNYTVQEQTNVTDAYTALVASNQHFMDICVQKHDAVVAHNAAHQMGQALVNTFDSLANMTDIIMTMVPAKADVMTTQMGALRQSYSNTVDLYLQGQP